PAVVTVWACLAVEFGGSGRPGRPACRLRAGGRHVTSRWAGGSPRKEGSTMPTTINPKLISWASDIDDGSIRQAEKTARLPIVEGHVALMPDAHVGLGATVG